MKTKMILKGTKCALLESKNNFIIAIGYSDKTNEWDAGKYYPKDCCSIKNAEKLLHATEEFLSTEKNGRFITRERLSEITTWAIQNLDTYEMENFIYDADIDIDNYEYEFFCIHDYLEEE